VRDETAGRYKTKALLIVAGIREDGYREILGLKLAENEGEDFWLELSEALKNHGLRRVKLVVVVGAFPNERSLIRLAVAILIDINEEWLTGRRCLDMEGNVL